MATDPIDLPEPIAPTSDVLDRWWAPGALALALAIAFVALLLVRADGDVSLLVHAGPPHTDQATARDSLTLHPEDETFDGQFFYRLGVSPWSTDETVAGVTFDVASLRNARWGYGALAWVASAGDPDLVPEALVALNLVAAFVVGAAGGGLVRRGGHRRAWGALFVLWPGFAYSLSMDTSELVATAFVLSGLLAARSGRWRPAALLLTAAVLTRDTTAVVPAGFALAGAWDTWSAWSASRGGTEDAGTRARPSVSTSLWIGAIPLVTAVAWQLLQRSRFGSLPVTSSSDANLAAPLGGLVELIRATGLPTSSAEALRCISVAAIVGLVAGAVWAWRRSSASLGERLAWAPAVVVVAILNAYLWSGATAFMRAATEAGVLSIAILLAVPSRRIPQVLAAGLGSVWVLTAVAQLSKLA